MAAIRTEALRKAFPDGTVALRGLDLVVAQGEFLTLLGPSGCGKSTTLRMLAGLEAPTAGRIAFDGVRVDGWGPARRNVAMVFQNYALYPHMTVRGNLEYPLRKRGVPRTERIARVARTAASLHLEPLLNRRPRQLSGGQQQRVALGRAMIRDPSVFLLDEPLSNLDAQLRTAMRAELVRIHRETGCTMVYVTHDQLEAMTMSDRIAVMRGGKLQQVGTPDAIYRAPANRFVAGFVGTPAMNFLPARLVVAGAPEDAVAGVRPEHVRLGGPGAWEVARVEPTGHETLVTVRAPHGAEVVARVPAPFSFHPGAPVDVAFDPGHVHLFDDRTGERLPGQPG